MTDVLIVGGGPAGLTAAIYAARAGKSVTVCEQEGFGGQITRAHRVRNYPGFSDVSGIELGDALCAHAMDAGAQTEFTRVISLTKEADGCFTACTEDGVIEARSLIFAGGAGPRPLGLAGEAALVGRGVSYCALCDGAFFRGMDVAVVGGGSTAVTDAIFLADLCRTVYLIHRRNGFRAEQADLDLLLRLPNVRIMTPCTLGALKGTDHLEGLTVTDLQSGAERQIAVSALFVALGRVPDCSLIRHLAELDDEGYACAGDACTTKTPGLFVAGDCRKKAICQLTTATADGTVAGIAACAYVDRPASDR